MTSLKKLKLDNNFIKKIPDKVFEQSLEWISLKNNLLSYIDTKYSQSIIIPIEN